MFFDPSCGFCMDMKLSDHGIEEPHYAHCEVEHEPGEHAIVVERRTFEFSLYTLNRFRADVDWRA